LYRDSLICEIVEKYLRYNRRERRRWWKVTVPEEFQTHFRVWRFRAWRMRFNLKLEIPLKLFWNNHHPPPLRHLPTNTKLPTVITPLPQRWVWWFFFPFYVMLARQSLKLICIFLLHNIYFNLDYELNCCGSTVHNCFTQTTNQKIVMFGPN